VEDSSLQPVKRVLPRGAESVIVAKDLVMRTEVSSFSTVLDRLNDRRF
jgi:hypothetical protein